MVLLPKTAPDPGTRRQWRPRAWAGRPAAWARAARGPERPQPASVRGLDSGPLGVLKENFAKESETRANLPGRDKVERLALSSCPPRRQRELSARGGSRTDPRGRRGIARDGGAEAPVVGGPARAHTRDSRGKWRSAFALRTFPQALSGARPSAPRASPRRPTIKATIETFPKRAIYLLPINRSAVIKKSMWPGWASRSPGGKGATGLRLRGGRRRARAWERRVPPGPHPRAVHLGARAPAGRVPSGGEGRAPAACFPRALLPFSLGLRAGRGRQRPQRRSEAFVAPRRAEWGFVKRDR